VEEGREGGRVGGRERVPEGGQAATTLMQSATISPEKIRPQTLPMSRKLGEERARMNTSIPAFHPLFSPLPNPSLPLPTEKYGRSPFLLGVLTEVEQGDEAQEEEKLETLHHVAAG